MFLKLFMAFLVISAAFPLKAQIFDFDIDYGALVNEPAVKAQIDAEILKIRTNINKDFPNAEPSRLLEGMANTSVMAGKGIGTDYASNMSVFLIGGGVGAALDMEKSSLAEGKKKQYSGAGIAPGFIVGANLGFMDTKTILGMDTDRLNLYFNFMSYDFKKKFEAKGGKESEAGLSMLAFGTHVRYDWIKGKGNKALGWGGVKLNFGFEYNKTDFNFRTKFSKDVNTTVAGTGETLKGTVDGNPEASINVSTMSIPLALSTDIQILYFVTLYTGLGLDYNMGEAKGDGKVNGNSSPIQCTGGAVCGGAGETVRVTPKGNLDTTSKVTPLTYRAFAGFQFNLPWTRLFVQADKSLSNEVLAATAGLRFAF